MKAFERIVTLLARWTALAGGAILVAIIVVTALSVTGRALLTLANAHDAQAWYAFAIPAMRAFGGMFLAMGARPIPGDYELVEAGTAFAIFAFLPWCHLQRSNATVELLTPFFPPVANRLIDLITDVLMLAFALLIGWRHWLGTIDKYSYSETTFILQFPVWWAYAVCLIGAAVFAVVAIFCVLRSVQAVRSGETQHAGGGLH